MIWFVQKDTVLGKQFAVLKMLGDGVLMVAPRSLMMKNMMKKHAIKMLL